MPRQFMRRPNRSPDRFFLVMVGLVCASLAAYTIFTVPDWFWPTFCFTGAVIVFVYVFHFEDQ